ncbi:unnamed protein product [Dracunculus medinensis]|uniref:Alpha/beta hydrolase fold-3 domain-containing protein n=1 Tax=Dracunculus medinensis TaxID=318479 RepID=A0A3P7PUK5_DRAME|nr:unnamed protein product [Dracunculus medinensis]
MFTFNISILSFFFFSSVLLLPDDIADRRKLQCMELLLRLSYEYCGNFVEIFFGPRMRIKFTRFLVNIPYLIRTQKYKSLKITDEKIGGVPVRIYQPEMRKNRKCIIYIHGGGWCIMQPVYYDGFLCPLTKKMSTTVISIKYRLAPENPFPIPLTDCETVYRQLIISDYKKYDIDPEQICLMGDSAGGNLGTVIIQRQLRKNLSLPKCQVLIYPVLHAFNFKSPSYQHYHQKLHGTSLLNPRMIARWFLSYLGIPATKKNVNHLLNNDHFLNQESLFLIHKLFKIGYIFSNSFFIQICKLFDENGYNPDFAPIMGKNLEGMCQTLVVTVGYDILLDEEIMYIKKLRSYGVKVHWNHYPSAYHGILNMPMSSLKKKITEEIAAYLESNL